MQPALTLDYEARSRRLLKISGRNAFCSDYSTGVTCLATQFLGEEDPTVFRPRNANAVMQPGDPCPEPILKAIRENIPIYAHNAGFDRALHKLHCVPVLGWPDIPDHLWRCTRAICAYYTLPQALEDACIALELPFQKNMDGHRVMMQLAKPKKLSRSMKSKLEAIGIDPDDLDEDWYEDVWRLDRNASYCADDVRAQVALLLRLGPLPPERLDSWRRSMRLNDRGMKVDYSSAVTSLVHLEVEKINDTARLQDLTRQPDGKPLVEKVTQVARLKEFCASRGFSLLSMNKDVVEEALKRGDCPPDVRAVLEIRAASGKTSIQKLKAMLHLMDVDHKIRDSLVWSRANTGRYAGQGLQPQNFVNKTLKPKEAEDFHRCLKEQDDPVGYLTRQTGKRDDFYTILSKAMRSFIIPSVSNYLAVSDFNAIEARSMAWLTGCQTLLTAFRNKICVYSQFASRIFGREITEKGSERDLGKVGVLALQYGMGESQFIERASQDERTIDLTEMVPGQRWDFRRKRMVECEITKGKWIVDLYRSTYPEIPAFWRACEKAMIRAIREQTSVQCGRLTFGSRGEWSWTVLPSGRALWYYRMELHEKRGGRAGEVELSRMTQAGTAKGNTSKKWMRLPIWGGVLAQNANQALCADLLDEAIARVEASGKFAPILPVHDEVVSEVLGGTVEEYDALMHVSPGWAYGLPIAAETAFMSRYGKP